MLNKRKHTRLPIQIKAMVKVNQDEEYIIGKTKNVSFGGICLSVVDSIAIKQGEECEVVLILYEGTPPIGIEFKCKVVHNRDSDLGFKFISINSEDYEHFKNLMVLNSSNPMMLLDELKKNPGILLS
ncbi:MAG: PilZ domain-containing protein [Desulfobacterales bacterium]|nr:PilZ domain-containing protein [Desulfobacterales bacterium]